ncbi:hypothetical protein C8F01DRAFT_947262, partial [Mycena amicta]
WLCDVYPELTTVNLGGAFNNTLAAFFALEAAYGFANGSGRVSAEGRPIQLHYWIQHKRVPKPDLCAIKDTAAFSKEYWGWWTGIQPSWREVTKEGRPGSAERNGESWGGLIVPGHNGMLGAVAMLCWWG